MIRVEFLSPAFKWLCIDLTVSDDEFCLLSCESFLSVSGLPLGKAVLKTPLMVAARSKFLFEGLKIRRISLTPKRTISPSTKEALVLDWSRGSYSKPLWGIFCMAPAIGSSIDSSFPVIIFSELKDSGCSDIHNGLFSTWFWPVISLVE